MSSNTFLNLINQSFDFPQEEFHLEDDWLKWNGVMLEKIIDQYGTPTKLLYLPKIRQQISRAKGYFATAIDQYHYQGKYHYCYCTKSNHYAHVIKTVLDEGVHLETSSSMDIDIILALYERGVLDIDTTILHNGHKSDEYLYKIFQLKKVGFANTVIILDSQMELSRIKVLNENLSYNIKIGIRMAIDESPQSAYYTSRLGMRYDYILDFVKSELLSDASISLTMLHFFVDSGIDDNLYFWGEFQKAVSLYVELKACCSDLDSLNLGGGFPIKNSLGFSYDYQHMVNQMIEKIMVETDQHSVDHPDIYTEFGKYTVGESGAVIFSVLEQKDQNDQETWYMLDNSLLNTIPDSWSIKEKFILLPLNHWNSQYSKINLGGITCDQADFYNYEDLNQQLILPVPDRNEGVRRLYVGFFHTGAYQDAISGYGGIHHCLVPTPKLLFLDHDDKGNLVVSEHGSEQTTSQLLTTLGYDNL